MQVMLNKKLTSHLELYGSVNEFEFIYSETNKNKRYTKYNKKVYLRIVLVYN
jgi:hypothetical protein